MGGRHASGVALKRLSALDKMVADAMVGAAALKWLSARDKMGTGERGGWSGGVDGSGCASVAAWRMVWGWMGGRHASGVALKRLSALDKMVAVGYSAATAECSGWDGGSWIQVSGKGGGGAFGDAVGVGAAALRRLSALDKMVAVGYSQLNSEMAFKAQMDMGGVRVERQNLSFCILTRRLYPLEDDSCPVKILSAAAKVPLNGAKCRFCTPCKAGEEAEQALAAIPDTAPNWPSPFTQGIDICSIHQPWEDTWQQQYDDVMGAELARQRQAVGRMAADVALCVRSFERLRALSSVWSAPSPLALCVRGQMGEAKLLGTTPRQFATFTRLLSSS
ncbi:unnamed protein product, partial [Closterium sp. Yama58-4]